MARTKPTDFEERARIVRSCITGNQERYGVDDEDLASRIGVTDRTIRNKRKNPEIITLGELQAISRVLKFTPIQAASIVLGRDLTAKEIRDFILK